MKTISATVLLVFALSMAASADSEKFVQRIQTQASDAAAMAQMGFESLNSNISKGYGDDLLVPTMKAKVELANLNLEFAKQVAAYAAGSSEIVPLMACQNFKEKIKKATGDMDLSKEPERVYSRYLIRELCGPVMLPADLIVTLWESASYR